MKNSAGFRGHIIVVIIVIVGILGVLGWLAWKNHTATHIFQGVKGTITARSGNCMPMAGSTSCKTGPSSIPTKVIIKQSISASDKTNKRIVKEINNVTDTFETSLAPGLYNMYVLLDGKEYCNQYGGQNGEDCEFTVYPSMVTSYAFEINGAVD